MKRHILRGVSLLAFIAILLCGLCACHKGDGVTEPPADGTGRAPDFAVTDLYGETAYLSDFFGRPIVINFWATWCPPCIYEMPHFNAAVAEYGEDVVFLMVNVDGSGRNDIPTAHAFMKENGYDFPVYFDLAYEASMAYGVSSIPMTVWIDRGGDVVHSHVGAIDEAYLSHYISEIRK